jgi:hypothetical protein
MVYTEGTYFFEENCISPPRLYVLCGEILKKPMHHKDTKFTKDFFLKKIMHHKDTKFTKTLFKKTL